MLRSASSPGDEKGSTNHSDSDFQRSTTMHFIVRLVSLWFCQRAVAIMVNCGEPRTLVVRSMATVTEVYLVAPSRRCFSDVLFVS